jgi:CO/xanthine dehydrogenase FAD-binding subunit
LRPFTYLAPKSLDEALQVLTQADGEVRALVGGTDLIDQMRQDRRSPSVVLDVKRIPETMRLEYVAGEGLHIGSAVPCTDTAAYPQVEELYSAIREACLLVGSIAIQNRASIGGNVCNASPSADTVPGLICHGARAVVVGPKGRREVLVEEFFKGPGQHVMGPDEILLETVVPPPPENSSSHYLRFIPRNEMDIAVVGVGSLLTLEPGTRRCTRARIALASVAPTPVRATAAEGALEGQEVTEELIGRVAERAVESCNPISDVRGSAEYRKELTKVLTRRTLRQCMEFLGQPI